MAAKRRRRRRSSPPRTKARRRGGGSRRGSVYIELAKTAAAGVGGFIGAQLLVDKFAPANLKTGDGRIAAKAAAALGIYMLGKRVSPSLARGAAIGGMTSAGLDLVARFSAKGTAGMGAFTDGNPQVRTLGEDGELAAYADEVGIS